MAPPLDGWDLQRYRAVLRQRASWLLRDPRVQVRFDESDLTNETLLNAVKAEQVPEGLDDDRARLAWLAAIQDHVLIDLHRRQFAAKRDVRREQSLQSLREALQESSIDQMQLVADPAGSPSDRAEQRELERLTDAAIDRLPAPQCDVLRLRQHGRTLEQIARQLGLTAPAVAGYYYRGLKKLRDQLGPPQEPTT
jgi:RNA polymerase sigma factor (sigma-70 family)